MKVRAHLFCGLLMVFTFAGKTLAQGAPATGTIEVKVPQAIDSDRDASGKEYAAVVTKTVNAGGVTITQGSVATLTLVKAADGTASVQLVGINIPGQGRVAASSSSVTVTGSPVQKAASRLGSALGSRLGGIAQGAAAPAVTPTASGARVSLTAGSTLQFALSMGGATTSAAAATPVAPAPVAAAPVANPAPIPASSPTAASGASAGGPVTAMVICFGSISSPVMYLTAAFEVPVNIQGAAPPVLEPAFSAYLKATYQYAYGITCQPIWTIADAQAVQKKLADLRDRGKPKVVDTGWRYGQPAVGPGQSGFDPLAVGPGGLDLSQHRLTTYYCVLVAPGGTTMVRPPGQLDETAYISPIFQADWGDSAVVGRAWVLYIRDHYVHDIDLNNPQYNPGSGCNAQSPAFAAMQHQGAGVGKYIGHKVPVDFTYTPDQAAAADVAGVPVAPTAPTTPATSSTGTHKCISPVDHKPIPCANPPGQQ